MNIHLLEKSLERCRVHKNITKEFLYEKYIQEFNLVKKIRVPNYTEKVNNLEEKEKYE